MPNEDLVYFYQGRKYLSIPLGEIFVDRTQETENNPKATTFVVQVQNISDKPIREIELRTNLPVGTYHVKYHPKELQPGQISELEFNLFGSKLIDIPQNKFPEHAFLELEYEKGFVIN